MQNSQGVRRGHMGGVPRYVCTHEKILKNLVKYLWAISLGIYSKYSRLYSKESPKVYLGGNTILPVL